MLVYCQLGTWVQTSVKFNQNKKLFIHGNASENIVCKLAAILSMRRWVEAKVPQSRVPPADIQGLSSQNLASQAGGSQTLHPTVFCGMQSPIPARYTRLRQQSPSCLRRIQIVRQKNKSETMKRSLVLWNILIFMSFFKCVEKCNN